MLPNSKIATNTVSRTTRRVTGQTADGHGVGRPWTKCQSVMRNATFVIHNSYAFCTAGVPFRISLTSNRARSSKLSTTEHTYAPSTRFTRMLLCSVVNKNYHRARFAMSTKHAGASQWTCKPLSHNKITATTVGQNDPPCYWSNR